MRKSTVEDEESNGLCRLRSLPEKLSQIEERGRMVRPERFELPAFWFVARRSIQLSYGRAL